MRSMVVILVVVLISVALSVGLRREPADRALLLRREGLGIVIVLGVLGTAFIAGETFDDPGGWAAVGLVTSWLVPMLALCVLAWTRPSAATPVLAVLTALIVAMSLWLAVQPGGWRSVEDDVGPIRALAAFAVVVPLGLLGWRRPRPAGVMLLVAGLVPVLAVLAVDLGSTRGVAGTSVGAVAAPAVTAGALYLAAAALDRRPVPPDARRPRLRRRPKTA